MCLADGTGYDKCDCALAPDGGPAGGSGGSGGDGGNSIGRDGKDAGGGSGGGGDEDAGGSGGSGNAGGSGGSGDAGGSGGSAGSGGSGDAGGSGGSGGAGGSVDAGHDAGTFALMDCMHGPAQNGPCGTLTTYFGTEIPLGPYGASMDANVGDAYELPEADGLDAMCALFLQSLIEDPIWRADVADASYIERGLYTVYRPSNWSADETFPLIVWANGVCMKPEDYGAMLRHVASHGFLVVASNHPYPGTVTAIESALDFMFAANGDASSLYYQRVDTTKVGAMGHGQGALAGLDAAPTDPRINAVLSIDVNGAPNKPFLFLTGDRNVSGASVMTAMTLVEGASQGAYLFFHMVPGNGPVDGYFTVLKQTERVVEAVTGWWQYILQGDAAARDLFIGPDCGLCNSPTEYEYGQHGLD
jgi:hypothetical protein